MSYVDGCTETVVISAFDDCDISGKAVHLTGNAYNDVMVIIKVGKDMRSRFAKYVNYNPHESRCKQRDRKPSRLQCTSTNAESSGKEKPKA